MVGQVGALHAVESTKIGDAVEYAFSLIKGWDKKERGPIHDALEELKAATENNKKVYQEASDALNQLSRDMKANRDLIAQAKTAQATAAETQRRVSAEVSAAQQKLQEGETSLRTRMQAHDLGVKEQDRLLTEREKAVLARERAAENLEKSVAVREDKVSALEARAKETQDAYESKIARLREIVA